MDLSYALEIIKENLRNYTETNHFKEQCEARNLNSNEVIRIIKETQILGIVKQDEELYKVWFEFEKEKDLNIIIKILPNEKLKFVTIFPCYSARRKR